MLEDLPSSTSSLAYHSLRLHLTQVHFNSKPPVIPRLHKHREQVTLEHLTVERCYLNGEDIASLAESVPRNTHQLPWDSSLIQRPLAGWSHGDSHNLQVLPPLVASLRKSILLFPTTKLYPLELDTQLLDCDMPADSDNGNHPKSPIATTRSKLLDLQSGYDTKIEECYAELRRLREARNAHCSSTRHLPAEVLCAVFEALAPAVSQGLEPSGHYSTHLIVTHVCRAWRNAALNHPALWTNFTTNGPHGWWEEAMILHSQSAPISLCLRPKSSKAVKRMSKILLESPERLKELFVLDNPEYLLELTKPAPSLEVLKLYSRAVLPTNFLSGHAPRLKSFHLSYDFQFPTKLHLPAPWLTNVRWLYLGGSWSLADESGDQTNVPAFLNFLNLLPHLEDLFFSISPQLDASILPQGTKLHLPWKDWDVTVRHPIEAFRQILDSIVLDSLRMFRVSTMDENHSIIIPLAMKFFLASVHAESATLELSSLNIQLIANTRGRLTKFSLYCGDFNNVHPSSLFSCFSGVNLEEFVIDGKNNGVQKLIPFSTVTSYQSLRRLHLKSVTFNPKATVIPQFKQWLLTQRQEKKLEHMIVDRQCYLDDEDIASLADVVPVISDWEGSTFKEWEEAFSRSLDIVRV